MAIKLEADYPSRKLPVTSDELSSTSATAGGIGLPTTPMVDVGSGNLWQSVSESGAPRNIREAFGAGVLCGAGLQYAEC